MCEKTFVTVMVISQAESTDHSKLCLILNSDRSHGLRRFSRI